MAHSVAVEPISNTPASNLSPHAQAILALAVAARDTADLAYNLAFTVDNLDPAATEQRLNQVRQLVIKALEVRRWRITAELLAGSSFADVAKALNLSTATVEAQFGPAVAMMQFPVAPEDFDPRILGDETIGTRHDPDPHGTAATVDAWLGRHVDFYEVSVPGPVTTAITGLTPGP